jgi:hypothetical protein
MTALLLLLQDKTKQKQTVHLSSLSMISITVYRFTEHEFTIISGILSSTKATICVRCALYHIHLFYVPFGWTY